MIDSKVLYNELAMIEDSTRKEIFKHERSGAEYWMRMGALNQITKLKHFVFDSATVEAKPVVHGEWERVGRAGDYIIRGVNGEIYPCKADIFVKTYEIAGELANDTNDGSKWIPCSELPKTNGVYQVKRVVYEGCFKYYIVTCAYFDGQNTWHNDNRVNHSRPYLKDVIAWKLLDEP